MATKKTTTPKKAVKAAPAKKATVTKTAAPAKKAAPVKKAAAPAAKKAVAVKKAVPAKKVAAPAKKAATIKKAAPVAKKVAAPAKKAATPAKKVAAPVKKTVAPAKKTVAAPAKKVAAPVKKAAVPVKKSAAPIKKQEPVAKKAAPVKASPAPAPKTVDKGEPKKAAPSPAPRPTTKKEDKPLPIIAHRKIEKAAPKEKPGNVMKEFSPQTRSVLDMPEQQTGPIYRYSDEDLNEFKELILKRIEAARDNLTYYQNLISRKDEIGDDSDNRLNSMEDGSGAMEKEQLSMMAARQVQFINNLEKALVRIENKTYGICRETGRLIDKARLRAVPHATLSIEAKNSMKK